MSWCMPQTTTMLGVIGRVFMAMPMVITMMMMPTGAEAQELLTNRHFTIDLSDWTGSGWWDAEDYDADPGSGSATFICQDPGIVTYYIARQCIDLSSPGEVYRLSGFFNLPPGQSGTGWGQLGMAWYTSAACAAASYVGGIDAPAVDTTGLWQKTAVTFAMPAEVNSVYVYTVNTKTSAGGVFQVKTDELSLLMLDKIFTDGFESGNTSQWSMTSP